MREQVWEKINTWRGLYFSFAGKEVLIKAVLQAIPSYVVSCFRLPLGLVEDIHKAMASIWWGDKGSQRKIHWCKWTELAANKANGGLGFRDIGKLNQALLAKNVWRLLRNPDSLVGRVFHTGGNACFGAYEWPRGLEHFSNRLLIFLGGRRCHL